MILSIPPKAFALVDHATYVWFISKLKEPKGVEFGNGLGHYQDSMLVAARLGERYYIRKKP